MVNSARVFFYFHLDLGDLDVGGEGALELLGLGGILDGQGVKVLGAANLNFQMGEMG